MKFIKLVETVILKVASAVLSLLLTYFLAKSYNPGEAGQIMFYLSLIALGGIGGTAGLAQEVTRVTALLSIDSSYETGVRTLKKMLIMPMIICLVAAILIIPFSEKFPVEFRAINLELVLLCAFLMASNRLFCAVLQGIGKFKTSIIFDQLIWISIVIFSIAILTLLDNLSTQLQYKLIFFSILVSSVATLLVLWLAMLKFVNVTSYELIRIFITSSKTSKHKAVFYKTTFWLTILITVTPLVQNLVNTIILSHDSGNDLATFQIASKIVAAIALLPVVFNYVWAPDISRLYAEQKIKDLSRIFSKTRSIVFILTLPTTIFFAYYASWLMSLFGTVYSEGYQVLIILLAGQLISTYFGSAVSFLVLAKKPKVAGVSGILAFSLSLLTYWILQVVGIYINAVFIIFLFQFLWNLFCCVGLSKILSIKVFYWPSLSEVWEQLCLIKR